MRIVADLQVHSKHARATSKNLSIENLEKYGKIKGLDLIGVGDFQHPEHRKEIDAELYEDRKGILRRRNGDGSVGFLWQTEVSLMFSQGGKGRAVHLLIFAPNKQRADEITSYLASKGRLDYDGRPIFGMSCRDLVYDLKNIDRMIEIIPAHCLLPDEKVICNPATKKISDIEIGEKVLTHTGNFKKVTETFMRPYKGKVFRISPYYFREHPINVTEEHPFLAIKTIKNCSSVGGLCKPNSRAKGKHKCTKEHYKNYKSEWILTKNLEINDVLLYPRSKKIEDIKEIKISDIIGSESYRVLGNNIVPNIGRQDKIINNYIKVDADFCRLIGYYLAEGYVVKKNNCVQFAFAEHEEEYIEEVINLMRKCFGVDLSKKRERHGYELYFYSRVLVDLFDKLFYEEGKLRRSFSKRLPDWMLYLPKKKQAEIFRGWWRGDAGVSNSEVLSTQMKLICLRIGIIPSVQLTTKDYYNKRNTEIDGRKITASHDCFMFNNLSFYEDPFNLLQDSSFQKFKTKLARRHGWMDGEYAYIPIKNIETSEYEGEVYNLEVEDDNSYVTPSATVHNCMTPWFGLFGSKSGFDSLKECFQDMAGHIYAVESGMSADPGMLWRFEEIASGKVNVVSFSDAHSHWPWRLGREATIFELEGLSYEGVVNAIRTGKGLAGTIETPPEYGKYHWDGHRNCDFSCSPEETKKLEGKCPKCNRGLIIGVDYRVEEVAQKDKGFKPEHGKEYFNLVPLHELVAFYLNSKSLSSQKVWGVYNDLIEKFGNELKILMEIGREDLLKAEVDENLIELIMLNRSSDLKVKPGFDGEYGKIVFSGSGRAERVEGVGSVKGVRGSLQKKLF